MAVEAVGIRRDLAQRLGYPPGTRLLVLHADDMGSCHAANTATFELMEAHRITSGSVLVSAPGFEEVVAYQRAHPEADIGIHLTLTSEHPNLRWRGVLGPEATPSLYDAGGYLPQTVIEVVQRADPEEAGRELRAQVEKALDAGIDVTHLDSHMGTIFYKPFLPYWTRLAAEFQLPTFIDAAWNSRPPVMEMGASGVPTIDTLIHDTYGPDEAAKRVLFDRLLGGLQPGFTHLLIHPAHDTAELQAHILNAETRVADYAIFAEGKFHERLADEGVVLVGHRMLRDAIRSGSILPD